MGYIAAIALCTVLLLQCAGVIAVAPGDVQSQCTSTAMPSSPGHALVGAYTSTQVPLMDSYWYGMVFGNGGVWEAILNNAANGWLQGQVTLCRSTMFARYQDGSVGENNWVATQFISRSTAQPPTYDLPITVSVTYRFLSCDNKRFGLYYYPSATEPSNSLKRTTSNYIHIGDVDDTVTTEKTTSFTFNLGSQYGGFFLAFRDQNSCGNVNRVRVYRGTCPQSTDGLVVYPETPTGATAVSVTHQCVTNANVSAAGLMCNPNGTWSGSPSCTCVPGHRAVGATCQGTVHAIVRTLL